MYISLSHIFRRKVFLASLSVPYWKTYFFFGIGIYWYRCVSMYRFRFIDIFKIFKYIWKNIKLKTPTNLKHHSLSTHIQHTNNYHFNLFSIYKNQNPNIFRQIEKVARIHQLHYLNKVFLWCIRFKVHQHQIYGQKWNGKTRKKNYQIYLIGMRQRDRNKEREKREKPRVLIVSYALDPITSSQLIW